MVPYGGTVAMHPDSASAFVSLCDSTSYRWYYVCTERLDLHSLSTHSVDVSLYYDTTLSKLSLEADMYVHQLEACDLSHLLAI